MSNGDGAFPFDDALYREMGGDEYEVVFRRTRSPEEMRPTAPRSEERPERLPWAQAALREETPGRERDGLD